MAKDTLHVVPNDDKWAVKREGNERYSSTHDTQKEAIEAARGFARDGDDIVTHRADGTIRDKVTYTATNGESTNGTNGSHRPNTHDILSVGTRVSWSAVAAGAVVAVAVYSALTMLAIALGVTTVDQVQNKVFAISALVIVIFNVIVSLFIGGYVVSRTTVGENSTESLIYGVLLWGVLFVFMLMTGAGLGFGSAMVATNATMAADDVARTPDFAEKLNLTETQKEKAREVFQEAREATADVSPVTVSWMCFGGIVLSLLASIAGSVCGAGPELVIRRLRERRVVVMKTA